MLESFGDTTTATCPAPSLSHKWSRCLRTVDSPQRSSNFGRPMRLDLPAARITTPKAKLPVASMRPQLEKTQPAFNCSPSLRKNSILLFLRRALDEPRADGGDHAADLRVGVAFHFCLFAFVRQLDLRRASD